MDRQAIELAEQLPYSLAVVTGLTVNVIRVIQRASNDALEFIELLAQLLRFKDEDTAARQPDHVLVAFFLSGHIDAERWRQLPVGDWALFGAEALEQQDRSEILKQLESSNWSQQAISEVISYVR